MTLADRLIEHDIATPDLVNAAVQRRQLYGGDLITNLLELTTADEKQLLKALSVEYGAPRAASGPLPLSTKAALDAVPRDVATTFEVFPLQTSGSELTFAASQPLSTSTAQELGVSLKLTPTVVLALAPRVKQAIARDYALPLDERTRRALERLNARSMRFSSRAPSPLGQGPKLADLSRPPSVAPLEFPEAWSNTPTGNLLNAETVKAPQVAKVALSDSSRAGPGIAKGATLAGYTIQQAEVDLAKATTSEEAVTALLDVACQSFDRCAVFIIRGARAELRQRRGFSGPQQTPFALSMYPKLQEVAEDGQWYIGPLQRDDPGLSAVLGDRHGHASYLGSVRVLRRTVLIVAGTRDSAPIAVEDIGAMLAVQSLVAQTLEGLLRKKRGR